MPQAEVGEEAHAYAVGHGFQCSICVFHPGVLLISALQIVQLWPTRVSVPRHFLNIEQVRELRRRGQVPPGEMAVVLEGTPFAFSQVAHRGSLPSYLAVLD